MILDIFFKFWKDQSPFMNKIRPTRKILLIMILRSVFIENTKRWQLHNLRNCLLDDIIDKISRVLIPINNIEDKLP